MSVVRSVVIFFVQITPLFKSKETSAADYYIGLHQEAEALRKEKKRSTISGVYKWDSVFFVLKSKLITLLSQSLSLVSVVCASEIQFSL